MTSPDQAKPAPQTSTVGVPELSQLAVVLIWASTFFLTKDALDEFQPLAFVFACFAMVSALSLSVLAICGARGGRVTYWYIDRVDFPRFAFATLIGSIPLLLIALPEALVQDWGAIGTTSWLTIVYMSIFPVYVSYMMWTWAIRQRGLSATSWSLLVPIVSGVLSVLVLDESFGPLKIFGGALAILGLVLMRPSRPPLPVLPREAVA